jgi:phosphatidate cytidylyltransferase
MHPLLIRVLSAGVLVLVFAGVLALGKGGLFGLVVVLAALALWEFQRLSGLMGFKAPIWLLLPLGFFFTFSGTELSTVPVGLVLAIALLVGLSVFVFLPGRRQGLGRWAMALAGAIYIGMPLNYYLLLYTSTSRGVAWLVVIVAAVVAGDAAALLVGSRIGRHLLFPAISPKKTWEGAVAGLLCCTGLLAAASPFLLGLAWWHGAALGVLVGVSGVVGDLVESQMKRLAGVKDSSTLIPGHGGLLDRLDSLLFPPIVVYLYVELLRLLS